MKLTNINIWKCKHRHSLHRWGRDETRGGRWQLRTAFVPAVIKTAKLKFDSLFKISLFSVFPQSLISQFSPPSSSSSSSSTHFKQQAFSPSSALPSHLWASDMVPLSARSPLRYFNLSPFLLTFFILFTSHFLLSPSNATPSPPPLHDLTSSGFPSLSFPLFPSLWVCTFLISPFFWAFSEKWTKEGFFPDEIKFRCFFFFFFYACVDGFSNGGRRWIEEVARDNSSFVLAARRTHRRDPLDNFKRYSGGWNISNQHYWAVSFLSLCFEIFKSGLILGFLPLQIRAIVGSVTNCSFVCDYVGFKFAICMWLWVMVFDCC